MWLNAQQLYHIFAVYIKICIKYKKAYFTFLFYFFSICIEQEKQTDLFIPNAGI